MAIISDGYASVILGPGEERFNLPSPAIASEGPPTLCFGQLYVGFMRSDHFFFKNGFDLNKEVLPVVGSTSHTENTTREGSIVFIMPCANL
jgi:hypothetical protein